VAVDHDISGELWACSTASDVINESKTLYYLARALKLAIEP